MLGACVTSSQWVTLCTRAGYRDSTYMHKDVGGKLHMGPLWDFNEAFGECCGYPIEGFQDAGQSGPGTSGGSAISTYGWRFNICVDEDANIVGFMAGWATP